MSLEFHDMPPTEMREQSGHAQAVDFWGQTRGNIHRSRSSQTAGIPLTA
jgi:hypothetical protein